MTEKKGFLLYKSWRPMIKALDADSRAQLFEAIFDWQCTGEYTVTNPVLEGYMALFITKFEEDNASYGETCERNRRNGAKGGRPKKNLTEPAETHENPLGFSETHINPQKPDKDKDKDKDINNTSATGVADERSLKKEFDELWELYPRKEGRQAAEKAYIRARKSKAVTKEEVENGIRAYNDKIAQEGTIRKYIMQGSTFFRGGRWADEFIPSADTNKWSQGMIQHDYDFDQLEKELTYGEP